MMTRKHFKLIAEVLNERKPIGLPSQAAMVQWQNVVLAFSQRLAAENPRFDAKRFEAACDAAGEVVNLDELFAAAKEE